LFGENNNTPLEETGFLGNTNIFGPVVIASMADVVIQAVRPLHMHSQGQVRREGHEIWGGGKPRARHDLVTKILPEIVSAMLAHQIARPSMAGSWAAIFDYASQSVTLV
jgi:hypothetical protein